MQTIPQGTIDERLKWRFDQIDRQFDRIDLRLDGIDERFELLDQRIVRIEDLVDRLADGLAAFQKTMVLGSVSMLCAVLIAFAVIVVET